MKIACSSLPLIAMLLLGPGRALAQRSGAPSPDTVKQALDRRWQQLRPSGVTQRNVLFQDVRAAGGGAGSYQFEVTALIRDYSPGYPANRFYGETCVSRIPKWKYTIGANGSGEWQVDGRMTPDLSEQQCKKNPSAGVSSIPLEGLAGTPAASGQIAAAPPLARSGGGVAQGAYECWAYGRARMLLNFSIRGSGQYTGSDGQPGSFSFDPATKQISFKGGALDGVMPAGFSSIYHEPQGRPTVSFRGPSGSEASFCQK